MSYKSLKSFVDRLEAEGELLRISAYVNPELEITEVADRFSKQPGGGKALLFEDTGTGFPLLVNSLGSHKRICMALGVDNLDSFSDDVNKLIKDFTSEKNSWVDKFHLLKSIGDIGSWMPKKVSRKGVCQEVVLKDPDLSIFPVLKCWPADGGRFITLPLVHTVDPVTGIRNLGMYRMQVFGKDVTGMHWHKHKTGARHYDEYKRLGKKMPVAVALGGDPIYTYVATAPLPDQIDEYILAGFIRKKRVELVRCLTQDIWVPCDADIIIEGYVDPAEDLIWEGPFGDHTGFYSLEDWYPKFHVTCITHRKQAIYPATIVGIPPQEDAWIAKATERIFLAPMKMSLAPELVDIDLPSAGTAHNLAILQIDKRYPGQGLKVINSLWGAGQMMFNKVMVVVDADTDIHNYETLVKYIVKNIRIADDLLFGRGPLDVLDHASDKFAFGTKLGIDATRKFPEEITGGEDYNIGVIEFNEKVFTASYPEFVGINSQFINEGYSLLILSIGEKEKPGIWKVADQMMNDVMLDGVKVVVCFDSTVDIRDLYLVSWQLLSNIEPSRDCRVLSRKAPGTSCLFVDATLKSVKSHNFERPWPNVVVSSQETIRHVNENWDKYFHEKIIESPSVKYQALSIGKGAVTCKIDEGTGID